MWTHKGISTIVTCTVCITYVYAHMYQLTTQNRDQKVIWSVHVGIPSHSSGRIVNRRHSIGRVGGLGCHTEFWGTWWQCSALVDHCNIDCKESWWLNTMMSHTYHYWPHTDHSIECYLYICSCYIPTYVWTNTEVHDKQTILTWLLFHKRVLSIQICHCAFKYALHIHRLF